MQNSDHSGYLSISEFAKISEVSRKALIFYDNAGVFSPKYVAPNGYRYYSHEQIYMISVITMFKDLGTPLSQIKEYVYNCNPVDAVTFLELRQKTISKKIQQLKGANDMLSVKLKNLKLGLQPYTTDVQISYETEQPLFISEPLNEKKALISDDEWMDFYYKCKLHNVIWGYPEGFSVSKENLKARKSNIAEHIICHVGNNRYANFYMPAGNYAIACGIGSFHDTEPIYQRLYEYIETKKLEISGSAYEKRLIDEAATENSSSQVIQVKIQIK